MDDRWRIELLGGLRAVRGPRVVNRFRTQKTAALLAYLALYRRVHPREALVDLFWPDAGPELGRQSLSQALSFLRASLDPPELPAVPILLADRHTIRLHPEAILTDVGELEASLRAAARAGEDAARRVLLLLQVVEGYGGELLPGFYEHWVLSERERLSDAYLEAVEELIAGHEACGDLPSALALARSAVRSVPAREESHRTLIRLLTVAGKHAEARRQQRALERMLRQESDERPPIHAGPPAAADQFTGATTRETRRSNLPYPLTRFFGREEEIDRLSGLLQEDGTRLVTLTGLGGSGKSRLAMELARRLEAAWAGRVWSVSLVDLREARRIEAAIRDALRLPRSAEREPREQILAALNGQPTLLILDNFEHLTAAGAPRLRELLERAPGLTVLATSRRRLGIAGERETPVGPLPKEVAVSLFLDRAAAASADFAPGPETLATVSALCEGLEGIPLAIELAAARAAVLPPAQMLARLSERFDLLVSRRADQPERHRSLRAALEWSFQLLSPELQRFFARLSVFRGGWTEQAATDVCEEPRALDALEQLRDASLIQAEAIDGEVHFRLLETVREFAAEQLGREERARRERRHAEFFVGLLERTHALLHGADQRLWSDRLLRELDNFRAAGDWCIERGGRDFALRFGAAIWFFMLTRCDLREARACLERALAAGHPLPPTPHAARAVHGAGIVCSGMFEHGAARRFFEQALPLRRSVGDPRYIAWLLYDIGVLDREQGDLAAARSHLEEGLAIFRSLSTAAEYAPATWAPAPGERSGLEWAEPFGVTVALQALAALDLHQARYRMAECQLTEGLAIARSLGNRHCVAANLELLGLLAHHRGEFGRARSLLEEARGLYLEVPSMRTVAKVELELGQLYADQDRWPEAIRRFDQARELGRQYGHPIEAAHAGVFLGFARCLGGEPSAGHTLLQESVATIDGAGLPLLEAEAAEALGEARQKSKDLEAAVACFRRAIALRQRTGAVAGLPGLLETHAGALAALGHGATAARLSGAAAALRSDISAPPPPRRQRLLAALAFDLRARLGEASFDAAWRDGWALTHAEATALALDAVVAAPDFPVAQAIRGAAPAGDLSDAEWERVIAHLSPAAATGRPRADDRRVLDGIRYRLRHGCSWHAIPRRYGSPTTCWRRYRQWQADGAWERIRAALDHPGS
jgi:predicted ATPase/DNA-binding SARP family transcriptional activator